MTLRIFLTALLLSVPAFAAEELDQLISGPVKYVVDGDTFDIGKTRIRLWGINTPESEEPGYEDAKELLKNVTANGTVNCLGMYYDRWKRTVASCEIDGQDIGRILVQAGVAIDYERYSNGFYQKDQMQAQANKRGLWSSQ